MKQRRTENNRQNVLRIVGIYAAFSLLWIYLSDTILGLLIKKPSTIILLSEIKGVLFVAVSVTLLYQLISQYLLKIRQSEDDLLSEKMDRELMIEHLPVGVLIHDADARIILSNQEAERILGLPAELLIDRRANDPCWHFVREDGTRMPAEEYAVLQVLNTLGTVKHSVMGVMGGGSGQEYNWVLVNAYPELTANGKLRQIVLILADISDMKSAEEQVQHHLQHLTALVEIGRAINLSFDLNLSLSTLLSQAVAQPGIDAAVIFLFDPSTQRLEYAAGRGFRGNEIEQLHPRLGEGYTGKVAAGQHIIQIDDLSGEYENSTERNHLEGENFVSYCGIPLLAKGEIKGVFEVYHRNLLRPDEEWFDFISALAAQAAIAIENTSLFEHLQRSNQELFQAYDATIEGWSRALDLRDHATEGHSQRVAEMTVELARQFGLSEAELIQIRWGALLHDIGKMGMPDGILRKQENLNEIEWDIMKHHPRLAYELLAPVRYLRTAIEIPYAHHERWDGSGYPRGLKGEEIPLAARIFAVVDVWDALRSERPYRSPWNAVQVREHIASLAGTHFDPNVIKIAMRSDIFSE